MNPVERERERGRKSRDFIYIVWNKAARIIRDKLRSTTWGVACLLVRRIACDNDADNSSDVSTGRESRTPRTARYRSNHASLDIPLIIPFPFLCYSLIKKLIVISRVSQLKWHNEAVEAEDAWKSMTWTRTKLEKSENKEGRTRKILG